MKGYIIEYDGKKQGHKNSLVLLHFPDAYAIGMFGKDMSGLYLPVPAFFTVACTSKDIGKLCSDCSKFYKELKQSAFSIQDEQFSELINTAKQYETFYKQTAPKLVRIISKIKP